MEIISCYEEIWVNLLNEIPQITIEDESKDNYFLIIDKIIQAIREIFDFLAKNTSSDNETIKLFKGLSYYFVKLYDLKQYEKIENVRDDKEQELLNDLRERTGLKIHKVSVVYIDFVKDSAELKIYFY